MAELRDAGAVGFSDDGLPIASARVMRRALQYQRLAGLQIALHEEDPELLGDGVMHEGEVSALLGMAGVPVVSESTMIARDCGALPLRAGARSTSSTSPPPNRSRPSRPPSSGRQDHLRGDPAPPHAHRRGGPQPRRPLQDEPAAAHRGRPPGADRGAHRRHDRLHRDRPRSALGEREGGPLRAGHHGRHRARDRLRGRSTPSSSLPGVLDLGAAGRAHGRRRGALRLRPAALAVGRRGQRRPGRPRAEWEAGAEGWESRSENSCFAGRGCARGRSSRSSAARSPTASAASP